MKCECGEKAEEQCSGCESIMCSDCLTGGRCDVCERWFCNDGNDECIDYVEHSSGKHQVCWKCIWAGLMALRKEKEKK